jgi:glucose/arabinose dehydrogenase/mono/diheme cytochrome c family protein
MLKRYLRSLFLIIAPFSLLACSGFSQFIVSRDNGSIQLPEGFQALVVADNVGEARQIAVRENGDIYAALMNPIDLGYVVAMRDTNGDGVMDVVKYFGELDSQCKSLRLYKDYLYVGSTTQIVRFPLDKRQLLPTGPFETVVSGFPTPKNHRSKNITFDDSGNLYVSAGSPGDSCQEVDRTKGSPGKDPCDELERYAGVWMFDADTLGQKQMEDGFHYATGIRNNVAFQWDPIKKALYGVQNGRDNLMQNWGELYNERESAELPSEEFQLIKPGSNFGWPYTYYDHEQGSRIINPEYGGDKKKRPESGLYDDPILTFPGHWAPVGLQFYNATQFPEKYRGGAFVAFHGSWNRAPLPQQGYNVVFVPFDGRAPSGGYESFAEGFKGAEALLTPNSATYRPTGLAVGPDGSLYVAEDQVGRIWKIMYTGGRGVFSNTIKRTEPSESGASPVTSAQQWDIDPQGQALYNQYCLACHQIDGSGVPNMQPSLIGSERLASHDKDFLIRLLLQGSEWIEDRQYNNLMASFAFLSDKEIAQALNYARARFANSEPTITAEEVGRLRSRYVRSN